MTVALENITRAVDGIATIRDVSLTLEGGTEELTCGTSGEGTAT